MKIIQAVPKTIFHYAFLYSCVISINTLIRFDKKF